VGVVLVSESTYRLLQALYDVRLRIFEVILLSLIAAALLSMIVAATIARPLRALQADAATVLDHRGRLTRGFRGTARWFHGCGTKPTAHIGNERPASFIPSLTPSQ